MSKRLGRFFLLARYCLQTAAHYFGEISSREKDHRDLRPQEFVDGYSRGQEERQHDRSHEENRDQRDPTDQLDIGDGEPTNQYHFRSAPKRQQYRERKREPNAKSRKQERQR